MVREPNCLQTEDTFLPSLRDFDAKRWQGESNYDPAH